MSSVLKWCEISEKSEKEKFGSLSTLLSEMGIENEFEAIECDVDSFDVAVRDAQTKYRLIRIGDRFQERATELISHLPSSTRLIGAADTLLFRDGGWTARNCLFDGVGRSLAKLQTIDLSGGVFILGATSASRAVIASLARIGFVKFNLADPDEGRARALTESLRRNFFGVQIQSVARHLVTQLPGVHSVGVNTLVEGPDQGMLGELFYFNFLKSGGIWIDLPLLPFNSVLDSEAKSVGAVVVSAPDLISLAESSWVEELLSKRLDFERLSGLLSALRGPTSV